MRKRFKMNRGESKRYFRKTADMSHVKNFMNGPMRGGIRL